MDGDAQGIAVQVAERIERAKFVVGRRLLDRRKASNLSQAKLSDRSGISRRCLQNIEAGVVCPDVYTLFKLGEALSMRPAEILEGL